MATLTYPVTEQPPAATVTYTTAAAPWTPAPGRTWPVGAFVNVVAQSFGAGSFYWGGLVRPS